MCRISHSCFVVAVLTVSFFVFAVAPIAYASGGDPVVIHKYTSTGNMSGPQSVAISGDYAYVVAASSNTLVVLDISDPTNPAEVGKYTSTGNNDMKGPYSVAVSGDYAYVAAYISDTVVVLDISDPTDPTEVGKYTSTGDNDMFRPYSVAVSGDYAYVAAYISDTVVVLDISDPTDPTEVGKYTSTRNDDMNAPRSVTVVGDYVYVAGFLSRTFNILDISDPRNPTEKGKCRIDGRPQDATVSGDYAYVASYSSNAFVVLNISDPGNPTKVGKYESADSGDMENPFHVSVSGDYAYVVAASSNTLVVLDISDPTNPAEVGKYTSTGNNDMNQPYSVSVSKLNAYVVARNSNTMTIFSINGAPIADFTFTATQDPKIAFSNSSTDPDGASDIKTYLWDFGDGNVSTTQNPTHIYGANGDYTVTLTVADKGSATSSTSTKVIISGVNHTPTITSSSTFMVGEGTTAVTTITATDSDGDPLSYSITGGADQGEFSINSSTGVLTFNTAPDYENPADEDGDNVYEVEVTVSDDKGGSDTTSLSVEVEDVDETTRDSNKSHGSFGSSIINPEAYRAYRQRLHSSSPEQTEDTSQRIKEIKKKLQTLLAQLQALKANLSDTKGETGDTTTQTFTRDLTVGDTGDDVYALQRFLNAHGFVLSETGPGSPGEETHKFGAKTRDAVSRYQSDHGITPTAGYFGPITRASVKGQTATVFGSL